MIQDNKRNLLHIELIRIIAACFVIFNHTGKRGFFLFSVYERGSLQYWVNILRWQSHQISWNRAMESVIESQSSDGGSHDLCRGSQ